VTEAEEDGFTQAALVVDQLQRQKQDNGAAAAAAEKWRTLSATELQTRLQRMTNDTTTTTRTTTLILLRCCCCHCLRG